MNLASSRMNSREKGYLYGLMASVITMSVVLIALSYGQMLGGRYKFIVGDLYTQCAPFAKLFVHKLFDGSSLYYSFNAGLGMNTSLLFAFYVFSPFNFLYLFSDGSNIDVISIAVFVIKAGMAAFSFFIYSRYNLKVRNAGGVIFSVGYALVSYGLVISEMTALYDGIYLLPLILVAIKYMVDNKVMSWLIVLYAILFMSSFYSGYIVGIASFGYFILYIFIRDNVEKRRKVVVKYFISVIFAFAISAFILAPALYEVLKQNAVDGEYIFSAVPIWNIISNLFPFHRRELNQMTPYYYCGIPVALLISGFFFNVKICKKYKFAAAGTLIIAWLTMSIMPLYSAAHMFNNPNGYTFRYVYIIAFVISSMGVIAFREATGIKIKAMMIADTIIISLYCMAPIANKIFGIHDNSPSSFYFVVTIALVILWFALFVTYIKKMSQSEWEVVKGLVVIGIILISFEACLNTYVIMTSEPRYEADVYDYRNEQAKVLTSEISEYDDSVYRVHYDWLMNPNQACLYGYYGTDLFASSMNLDLQNFLYKIGLQSETYYLANNGSTDLTRFLLDAKYNLHAYVQYEESNVNYIDENPTAGLGFMVGEAITGVELGDNVFENQNVVYSALIGDEILPYKTYMGEVSLVGDNVDIYTGEAGEIWFKLQDGADIGYMTVSVPTVEVTEEKMYSWLSTGNNFVTPESPVIVSPDISEGCGYVERLLSTPHIIPMSIGEDCYEIYVLLARGVVEEMFLTELNFAYYDDSYIKLLQDKLSKQSFNVETFEDGYVTGNITAIEPGICFVAIPYEDGWSAIVDGKAQEITPLFNEAFIGIPLDAGYHEVELRFEAPFSRLGCIFSMFGVMMLIAIGATEVISQLKKSKIQ